MRINVIVFINVYGIGNVEYYKIVFGKLFVVMCISYKIRCVGGGGGVSGRGYFNIYWVLFLWYESESR